MNRILSISTVGLGWWRQGYARVNCFLSRMYRLNLQGHFGSPHAQSIQLRSGTVLRLAGAADARRLEVQRGTVWLTSTPGDRDVLLESGGKMELTGWPVVVEALADAEVRLVA